jgi:pimeloyl-ACP methyl ester carboxylesterase
MDKELHLLNQWRQKGQILQIFDRKVFVVDEPPQKVQEDTLPTICILHGFPSSSIDYRLSLPHLSKHHRVVLVDFVGFGFSDKPKHDYSYSLIEQTDIVLEVWKRLRLENIHIISHDYGTSILTEILARRERGLLPKGLILRSITFCNGSFHIEKCSLAITQQLLLTPILRTIAIVFFNETMFKRQLRRICSQGITDSEISLMWKLLVHDDGKHVLGKIINYVNERYYFWNRWIGSLRRVHMTPSTLPVLFLWGDKDPIALPTIASEGFRDVQTSNTLQLQSIVKLKWLNGLGHYPMLENTDLWCKELLSFLSFVEEKKITNLGQVSGSVQFNSTTMDSWSKEGIRTDRRVSLSLLLINILLLLVVFVIVLFLKWLQ